MGMEKIQKLRNDACKALDDIAESKSTDLVKSADDRRLVLELLKIVREIDEHEMREEMKNGSSAANRGMHYVRGHYSHDGGSSAGHYGTWTSHAGARNEMMDYISRAMSAAPDERHREAARNLMMDLERM